MIELDDGRWYMVSLGKRNDLDGDANMGRETYLMPMQGTNHSEMGASIKRQMGTTAVSLSSCCTTHWKSGTIYTFTIQR